MQKIKLEVLQSWFQKNLTGHEIDFLIVLSFYQSERGVVQGVHYKQIMEEGKMCAQSFYDCKKSLTEKGVISCKGIWEDYDITIIGNDFSKYTQEDYKNGSVKYVSTNAKMFRLSPFQKLKPKQKLLAMDLFRILKAGEPRGVKAHKISREKFYEKYANETMKDGSERKGLLDVSKRTLQKYLKMLQLCFHLFIRDGYYFFTLRKEFGKKALRNGRQTENEKAMEQVLTAACRRNRVKERETEEWQDIVYILRNYKAELQAQAVDVTRIIFEMIERLNQDVTNPRKWKRRLKASMFMKLLKEKGIIGGIA